MDSHDSRKHTRGNKRACVKYRKIIDPTGNVRRHKNDRTRADIKRLLFLFEVRNIVFVIILTSLAKKRFLHTAFPKFPRGRCVARTTLRIIMLHVCTSEHRHRERIAETLRHWERSHHLTDKLCTVTPVYNGHPWEMVR